MDARTQSALLAGIVMLALALAMLLRQARKRLWTAFAILNLVLFGYELGEFFGALLHGPSSHAWSRLTLAAAGLVPAAALGFIVEFQGDSAGKGVGLRRMALVFGALTLAAAFSPIALVPA